MNDRLAGVLLGTAVGDALGLPAEGLSLGCQGSHVIHCFNLESSHFRSPLAYWTPSSRNCKSVAVS